jgi:hypothetical protein
MTARTLIGGEAPAQAFGEVRGEDLRTPDRGIAHEREQLLPAAPGLAFERPPKQQRQVWVGGVGVTQDQFAQHRQGLAGGEAARGTGELAAHLDIRFGAGECGQRGDGGRFHGVCIAEQADGPAAQVGIGVAQGGAPGGLVEFVAQVQDPEGFEGGRRIGVDEAAQVGRVYVGPAGDEEAGLFAEFTVRVGEESEEFGGRHAAQIARGGARLIARGEAEDAAVGLVPGVAGVEVAQAQVGPVGDVDGAVGALLDVDRAEGFVVGRDERGGVGGTKGRGGGVQPAGLDAIGERHARDNLTFEIGEGAAFVEDDRLGEARAVAFVGHVLEEPENERIHGGAVLRPALHVGRALRVVEPAGGAGVGAGEGAAELIEFKAEGVAAALGEDLEHLRSGVIAPDALAEQAHALDLEGGGAARGAVDPAVRTPVQAAGERVRVLEPEARQVHLGIAVGHVVAVAIGIEEKVGRHQHPDAVDIGQHAGGEVEAVDKRAVGFEGAVAVAILEDGDPVGAAEVARGRRRYPVEFRADVLVVGGDREAGGKRILQVLDDPEAAAGVEAQIDWLADGGFAGDKFDDVAFGQDHAAHAFRGWQHGGLAGEILAARLEVAHEVRDLRREARVVGARGRGEEGGGEEEGGRDGAAHRGGGHASWWAGAVRAFKRALPGPRAGARAYRRALRPNMNCGRIRCVVCGRS